MDQTVAEVTRSAEVAGYLAGDVRQALSERVRLRVEEKRTWLRWVKFTLTGPEPDVAKGLKDIAAVVDDDWEARMW